MSLSRAAIEGVLLSHGMSHDEITRALVPDPQIIRSIETAHGRHADSIIMSDDGAVGHGREASEWDLPAVVVASGAHVRACREALEGETK